MSFLRCSSDLPIIPRRRDGSNFKGKSSAKHSVSCFHSGRSSKGRMHDRVSSPRVISSAIQHDPANEPTTALNRAKCVFATQISSIHTPTLHTFNVHAYQRTYGDSSCIYASIASDTLDAYEFRRDTPSMQPKRMTLGIPDRSGRWRNTWAKNTGTGSRSGRQQIASSDNERQRLRRTSNKSLTSI